MKVVAQPTRTPYVFGSAIFEQGGPSYKSKLRAFVLFMLDNLYYDDSPVPFYDLTPKGIVSCEAKAVSHFLMYYTTKPGQLVMDVMSVPAASRNEPTTVSNSVSVVF
jgi:hypothetical protein